MALASSSPRPHKPSFSHRTHTSHSDDHESSAATSLSSGKSFGSSRMIITVAIVAIICGTFVQVAEARPEAANLVAMADALKYLHKLDQYYSQMARPSTRSAPGMTPLGMEDTLKRYLQLQDLGKFYVDKARPRFGKRSESAPRPVEENLLEASQRLLDYLQQTPQR